MAAPIEPPELGALVDRNDWAEVDVAGFWRRTDGMIRLSPTTNMLANIGEVTVLGVDARVTLFPYRAVRGGAGLEQPSSHRTGIRTWPRCQSLQAR